MSEKQYDPDQIEIILPGDSPASAAGSNPDKQSFLRRLTRTAANTLLSRKFLLILSSFSFVTYALWHARIEQEAFADQVIWGLMLYFAGNLFQTAITDPSETSRPLADRMVSRKFIIVIGVCFALGLLLWTGRLSSGMYVMVNTWALGMYFGVDVAEIIAFRNKVGKMEGLAEMFKQPPAPNTSTTVSSTTTTVATAKTEVVDDQKKVP